MKVIFENGHSREYDANQLSDGRLYKVGDNGKLWVASIHESGKAIIESGNHHPIKIEGIDLPPNELIKPLLIGNALREVSPWRLQDLKRALTGFNAKKGEWK